MRPYRSWVKERSRYGSDIIQTILGGTRICQEDRKTKKLPAVPLPCLYLNVKDTSSRTAPLSLNRAVVFVLRFLSGREPGGV